jgi:uncharacterized protein (TIGR02284 family)
MLTPTTESLTPKIIRTLNTCIEVCIDGEKGYAIAAANVRDETLKALFHKYAEQREDFVRALQRAIDNLGGYAENEGSTKGTLHRGLSGARIALEGRTDEVILGECERGELGALAAYDRAFAKVSLDAMPPNVRSLLIEQRAAIQSAYDDITREDIRRRFAHH